MIVQTESDWNLKYFSDIYLCSSGTSHSLLRQRFDCETTTKYRIEAGFMFSSLQITIQKHVNTKHKHTIKQPVIIGDVGDDKNNKCVE